MLLERPVLCIGPAPYQTIAEGFEFCPELSELPDAIGRALERAISFVSAHRGWWVSRLGGPVLAGGRVAAGWPRS